MGHINGKTEILNKSQIAATMSYSVAKGFAQLRNLQFNPQVNPQNTNYNSVGLEFTSEFANAINQQNELLAEQNRLLGIIAEKDVSISSRDVFTATRKEANNYYNRTGNSPFLY